MESQISLLASIIEVSSPVIGIFSMLWAIFSKPKRERLYEIHLLNVAKIRYEILEMLENGNHDSDLYDKIRQYSHDRIDFMSQDYFLRNALSGIYFADVLFFIVPSFISAAISMIYYIYLPSTTNDLLGLIFMMPLFFLLVIISAVLSSRLLQNIFAKLLMGLLCSLFAVYVSGKAVALLFFYVLT